MTEKKEIEDLVKQYLEDARKACNHLGQDLAVVSYIDPHVSHQVGKPITVIEVVNVMELNVLEAYDLAEFTIHGFAMYRRYPQPSLN